jgi:hypothetical protein
MLPTIKSEPFNGNIKRWSRFWVQSESSVNKNLSVSNISKHVFLCGYLDDESKRLLDGASVTAEMYEKTKKILQAWNGDKNRIIHARLDYSEDKQPAQSDSPDAPNQPTSNVIVGFKLSRIWEKHRHLRTR